MTMHYIFSNCFFYDEKNTAPATVKVRGHISAFGNYVRGENTSVVNGTRLRNFEIENCNLSTNASLELEPTLFTQGFNKMMVMSSSTLSKDAAFNKVPGTITIKGPVKEIPTVYFEDNSALSHVTVRTPVSSPLRIMTGAFRNCFRYDTDGTVNISGDISSIYDEAFYAPTNLMTVTIDNTKGTYDLRIGANAFRHGFKRNAANADGGLINISGKIYYIGQNSFADATYLNTVDIANGRSDKPLTIKIGAFRNAFRHADSGIVTLGGNLAAIEDSAFYAPTNLNKLTIVNTAGTSNLTIGKRAFMNGFRHASRGVMMMDGKLQTIADSAFYAPTNLNSVAITNTAGTSNLTIGERAFMNGFRYDDNGTVNIAGNVSSIGTSAFYAPTNLNSLTINNTSTTPLTIGTTAFDKGFRRTGTVGGKVDIKGNLKEIGQYAIAAAHGLNDISIDNTTGSGDLTIVAGAFRDGITFDNGSINPAAGKLVIKGKLASIGDQAFSYLSSNTYKGNLTNVTINNTGTTDLTIAKNAFNRQYSRNVKGILSISGKLKEIGVQAFYSTPNLMNVQISNGTSTSDLIIGERAFQGAYKRNEAGGLFKLDGKLSKLNTQTFKDATYLNTVTILNGKSTGHLVIDKHAFLNCFRHASHGAVTLTGKLQTIGDSAFIAPTNLMTVAIDNTAGTNNLTVGASAFRHGFKRAEGVAGSVSIKGKIAAVNAYAFEYPTNLMTVDIQNTGSAAMTIANNTFAQGFRRDAAGGKISITGPVKEIGNYAFHLPTYCDNITINNTHTTSGLSIGLNAFEKAFQRAAHGTANITGNLANIGKNAFHTPTNLMTLNINNNVGSSTLVVDSAAFRNGFRRAEGNLGTISIQGRLSKIAYCAVGWGYNANTVTINNTGTTDLVIEKWAFPQAFRRENTAGGDITITGRLKEIGAEAFHLVANCKKVTINNTGSGTDLVIGEKAFAGGFTKYTDAVGGILAITGKLKEIGVNAFNGCANLMDVQISNGTSTYDLVIGENAFKGAYLRNEAGGLFKLDGKLSKLNTQTFKDATYLNTVTILNGQSAGHLVIDKHAFQNCFRHDSHGAVTLTGKLLTIGDSAFVAPTNLMTVAIDNTAGTSNLTIGASAFRHGFKRSAGTTGSVTIKGKIAAVNAYAFEYPTNLMTVDIQNTGTTDMTIANQVFPEGFRRNATGGKVNITGRLKSIGKWAFNNNTYMQTVTIDNTGSTADLEIAEQAFQTGFRHDSNGTLTLTGKVKSIGASAFNAGTNLMNVSITHTASANPLSIGANAFNSTFLRTSTPTGKLTMNGKLASIGKSAFRYTRALKNVNITNSGTTAAVIDTMAFYAGFGCKVQSSAFETLFEDGSFTYGGPLKELGYQAFYDAYGLKTVTLNTTTEYRIMDMCFRYNHSLSELNSNNGSTKRSIPSMVRYIGTYAFQNTGFTEMTIPNLTLKPSWNPNITESNPMKQTLINQGSGDQYYPSSANAHDWYNINGNFGDYIFADCRNLQKVTINSTTTGGRAVFRNCKELTDVTLGTTVKFIEQYSFEGCTKLDHLFVPKTVSLIGTGIMYRGAPAHRITFEGTQPPHAVSNAFNGNKPNLVVPKGSVSSYLFSADNLGFQQVAGDNISCEYNLASSGWGSLGMQAHKIKEYKATVNAGRVKWLSIVDDRGTFIDVYDTRRIGVTNVDGIVTDVAPSDVVNVYTADYYYPETKKVGIDKIENFAVVPQNTSTTNRNIGYLVEGEGGTTYYLHHYTGGDMSSKIAANGETYSYGTVRDAAKSAFDSEDIPCPSAFGGSTYSRTGAPNLLIAYTGTTYTQGQSLAIDGGQYFGTEPCYYYGFAGGQFRKIGSWSNFKEGNAFIAIPKRLMDQAADGKEVLTFNLLSDDGDSSDDDINTTGISDLSNDDKTVEEGRDEWYTLNGIKLPERPTQKGVYIHNGRKEVVR